MKEWKSLNEMFAATGFTPGRCLTGVECQSYACITHITGLYSKEYKQHDSLLAAGEMNMTTKTATRPTLKYFKHSEFRDWYSLMSTDLLVKLDAFREAWGAPVRISPASRGIGRHDGPNGTSQHNVDRWGEVRAVDVFPLVEVRPGDYSYMESATDRQRAYDTAKQVGFTGIGLYTDTQPGNMLHVDIRERKGDGQVAIWSRVAGNYESIYDVLA